MEKCLPYLNGTFNNTTNISEEGLNNQSEGVGQKGNQGQKGSDCIKHVGALF